MIEDNIDELEPVQYLNIYEKVDVPLIDISSSFNRIYTLWIAGLMIIAILFGYFMTIPNYNNVPIRIEESVPDFIGQFSHPVRIKEKFIQTNEQVEAGQAILTLQSDISNQLLAQIKDADEKLSLLLKKDSLLLQPKIAFNNSLVELHQKKLSALGKENLLLNEWSTVMDQVQESELDYYADQKKVQESLFEKGINSEMELKQHQNTFQQIKGKKQLQGLESKTGKEKLSQEITEVEMEYLMKKNELVEIRNNFELEYLEIHQSKKNAERRLASLIGDYEIRDGEFVLLAPDSGQISFLSSKNAWHDPFDILYRIDTNQDEFIAMGEVSPKQISLVDMDANAKISLESLPFFEWGVLDGTVKEISRSPNEEGNYNLMIAINNSNKELYQKMQNGQTGKASILIEEHNIFYYLLRKFKRAKSAIHNEYQ